MKHSIIIISTVVIVVVAFILIFGYNGLSSRDEKVITAWNPLEGALNERYTSIPRIIGAVQLYVGHNIPSADELSNAYPAFGKAETIAGRAQAANTIENLVQKLAQDIAERYPGISSNYQVTTAWNIYKGTSDKVRQTSAAYNQAATNYNSFVRKFPINIVAPIFGFTDNYSYIQPQL